MDSMYTLTHIRLSPIIPSSKGKFLFSYHFLSPAGEVITHPV